MTDLDQRFDDLRAADADRVMTGFSDVLDRRRRRRQRRAAASGALVVVLLASATVAVAARRSSPRQHLVTGPGPVAPITRPSVGRQFTPPPLNDGVVLKDLTWISASRGWALLDGDLRTTTDGGQTWSPIAPPPAATGLRFANVNVGYAFGPRLSMTIDGGKTWVEQPSNEVVQLEPSGTDVIRVTTTGGGCPGACAWQIERAAVGSTQWQRLRQGDLGRFGEIRLVRSGEDVYLAVLGDGASGASDAHAQLFVSHDRGSTWITRQDPCPDAPQEGRYAIQLAAAPGGVVAVSCSLRAGDGADVVVVSTNGGHLFGLPRQIPAGGTLAVTSADDLFVSTLAGRFRQLTARLYGSHDGGRSWAPVATDARQPTTAGAREYVGFQDASTGRWSIGLDTVWTTTDGGTHWTQYRFT